MTQQQPETPPPAVGQIWQDNDPRGDGRTIRIVEIDGAYAMVQSVHPHLHRPGRRTRIRLDRLRPTRNGYRYVGHPEDTDPSPLTEQRLADIADRYAVYERRHGPTGITCCSAHPVADAVPELLDEVRRLRAETERLRHALVVDLRRPGQLPEPGEASGSSAPPTNEAALRDRIAAAIYERNNPGYQWADAHPDDRRVYGFDADAVLAVLPSSGCLTPEYTDGPCHCPACDPAAHRTDRSAVLADVERAIRTATGSCGYKAEDGCGNCDGVDPDTCFNNPNRPPEQCPAAEFEDYGQQCQKPAGHDLHSFEEQPADGARQDGAET